MRLRKHFTQLFNSTGQPESSFIVTVEYDPDEQHAELMGIETYNHVNCVTTDITAIMCECFDEQTNDIMDNINWPELYAEERIEQREYQR